jgi:hypothetical protein
MRNTSDRELIGFIVGGIFLLFLLINSLSSKSNPNYEIGNTLSNIGGEDPCTYVLYPKRYNSRCYYSWKDLSNKNDYPIEEREDINPMDPVDFRNYTNPASPYFGGE